MKYKHGDIVEIKRSVVRNCKNRGWAQDVINNNYKLTICNSAYDFTADYETKQGLSLFKSDIKCKAKTNLRYI